ncbi:helix-turn-helix transcriptional regulator [Marivirga sp. S37H4]|uniref:Helix-turn-helix transcriptional regulator n=1 Tax=Marivirga aurantiaca TaxID=2802615 RepID=A0A934X0X0_9BACT|nr:helix-turn-helix transcriptional regulator [Marivirga aurantiaca]MBK6266864.1 helix-turn-helix transcriptional regulator [Marivirga aurantiaca]
MSVISSNIKYLRNKKGISQTALAEAVNLKRGNIASYEKELAQPSIENLMKLSDYFKVDITQFIKQDLSKEDATDNTHSEGVIIQERHLFQGLKDRVTALKGSSHHDPRIQNLRKQNDEIFKMVHGFKAYHKHRMQSIDPNNESIKKIASDYDNIIDLLETVLNSNKDLIKLLDKQ